MNESESITTKKTNRRTFLHGLGAGLAGLVLYGCAPNKEGSTLTKPPELPKDPFAGAMVACETVPNCVVDMKGWQESSGWVRFESKEALKMAQDLGIGYWLSGEHQVYKDQETAAANRDPRVKIRDYSTSMVQAVSGWKGIEVSIDGHWLALVEYSGKKVGLLDSATDYYEFDDVLGLLKNWDFTAPEVTNILVEQLTSRQE